MNFINPVKNPRITSKFGKRTIASLGIYNEMHYGLDLVSNVNDLNIYVSCSGKVMEVAKGESCGKYIKVKHTLNGVTWYTIYAHLSSQKVKEGQDVKQGDVIGVMGMTGRATGIHLHFEIREGSQKRDPELYLNKATTQNEYKGQSIVDYLKFHKQKSDFTSRRQLAEKYKINNYTGTSEQNIKLLKALRGY